MENPGQYLLIALGHQPNAIEFLHAAFPPLPTMLHDFCGVVNNGRTGKTLSGPERVTGSYFLWGLFLPCSMAWRSWETARYRLDTDHAALCSVSTAFTATGTFWLRS